MRIGYNRNTEGNAYGAIVLAAGLSSRMGDFKPLLYVDGRSAVEGIVESIRGSGIEDILVVTGFSREKLTGIIEGLRIREAYNEDYEDGMFSSVGKGLGEARRLWPDKRGYLIFPVDCPIINIDTIRTVMGAAEEKREGEGSPDGKDCFIVPTYEGKKGHPLLIPAQAADEILKNTSSSGLKEFTENSSRRLIRVPVKDEGCVMDMDDAEGYEEIRRFVSGGFRREKLSVATSRRRIIMVRHGQTRQHEGPVFIGQYDVPLNEEGLSQARDAALEVAEVIREDVEKSQGWVEGISLGPEPMPPVENIYCSDLSRAVKTAEIIAEEVSNRYGDLGYRPRLIPLKSLREVSLGDWDGRLVDEIRERFPQDFEARGRDVFTFKKGNGAENFYDMQYRVMKALRHILAGDDGRNIIIVAHSGVIRALENNLKGLRVDDQWEPLEKGDIRIWDAPPVK